MTRYKDQAARLKEELNEALNDERYRNLSFVSVGNLSRANRNYLTRHMEKIGRLQHRYDLCVRMQRIVDGEVFTLDDIDKCRMEIMRRYPEYGQEIGLPYGIIFTAEAIRKSLTPKYDQQLHKHPIRIDFGTDVVIEIDYSNFIRRYPKKQNKRREAD
ncbi:hypothetical protein [Alistipes sp. CHKCI003]|uniref:hypothetical protein n=1 Tax=Alistipes sp. CHKCI003 TaxID=1780376 RepID=UPI0007A935E0|nr:hypothetical protein [Alistipes sp. CHKCI003]CVI71740.1 hypothetical protein BN3659_02289 [Alistipes sp. CHKCI003]